MSFAYINSRMAINLIGVSIQRSHNETHWRLGSLGHKRLAEMQATKRVHFEFTDPAKTKSKHMRAVDIISPTGKWRANKIKKYVRNIPKSCHNMI